MLQSFQCLHLGHTVEDLERDLLQHHGLELDGVLRDHPECVLRSSSDPSYGSGRPTARLQTQVCSGEALVAKEDLSLADEVVVFEIIE